MPVRKMTRIALLSAILYIAKVILEFLPNVELISFFTIIYTLVFGQEALLIVTVFNMFELVQWGFGIWWISYLYVWPLLVLVTMLIKKLLAAEGSGKQEFVLWAVVSGGFGFLFGLLFSLAYLPVSPAYAFSYWISGLPWDIWHGVSNFVLMLLIGRPVYLVISKTAIWK